MKALKFLFRVIFGLVDALMDISDVFGIILILALLAPIFFLTTQIPSGHPIVFGAALVGYWGLLGGLLLGFSRFKSSESDED